MMKVKIHCFNSDFRIYIMLILYNIIITNELTCLSIIGLLHCASVVIILRMLFLAFSTYHIYTTTEIIICMQFIISVSTVYHHSFYKCYILSLLIVVDFECFIMMHFRYLAHNPTSIFYVIKSFKCLAASYLGGSGIDVQLNIIGGLNFYVSYVSFPQVSREQDKKNWKIIIIQLLVNTLPGLP